MERYLGELIGTIFLIYLGNGVVANVVLYKTKGNHSGFFSITVGWACAVTISALIFDSISGAFFNPALTIALATIGRLEWSVVPGYIICQTAGAFIGACLVYLHYKNHFDATEDKDAKLGVFCTAPAIRNIPLNFISEFLTTLVLSFTVVGIGNSQLGSVNAFAVGGIIFILGMGLGGTTGYAINPARDLGPRIAHFLLPIKNKRDSDWSYAWIPVLGPITGAMAGAILANILFARI